jgi:hypothetical protein
MSRALQIPEAAVDGAEVIERRTAAEVIALDEGHRQTALQPRHAIVRPQIPPPTTRTSNVDAVRRSRSRIMNHPSSFQLSAISSLLF